MMMRGRPIVRWLGPLFFIALVIGVGVLAFNAGTAQGSFLGLEMAPLLAGLLTVLLALFVIRLVAPLLLFPLFGLGFLRGRRFGFGRGWGRHHWKRHGYGWRAPDEEEDWVPPELVDLHRRLHERMEAEGEDETGTRV